LSLTAEAAMTIAARIKPCPPAPVSNISSLFAKRIPPAV
jgi:hypothetical protein